MSQRTILLPLPVAAIYRAVAELEALYPGGKFTPDSHLVGSIGEVVAAEALGLTLYAMSYAGHEGRCASGADDVGQADGRQERRAVRGCDRLVVLRLVSPDEAEIVYHWPGEPAWAAAGKLAKNGQRAISLAELRRPAGWPARST